MTVGELEMLLVGRSPDEEVGIFWDGADRGRVEAIYFNAAAEKLVIVGDLSVYAAQIKQHHVLYMQPGL